MERIPISGPWITQKEINYVTGAVTNAWYDAANMYHERFEKASEDGAVAVEGGFRDDFLPKS